MTRPRTRTFALCALLALLACGLLAACAQSVDENRTTYVGPIQGTITTAPDFAQYKAGVDAYLGKRCGSLDCHGALGRPLRLFSPNGMRAFDAGPPPSFPNGTGQSASTDDEVKANYLAVIGLEPELMAQVIAEGGRNPNKLLLLKKARLLEGHKGGQIMACPTGVAECADEGYRCVTSWIAGTLDQGQCDQALLVP